MSEEEDIDARRKRNDEIWQRRADKLEDDFTKKPWWTSAKWIGGFIALTLILSIAGGILGFVVDWGSQPKRIYGVENVRKTWARAYELDRKTTAQARIVCTVAQTNGLAETVSGSPLLAAVTTYNRVWGEYSELVSNKLEGGRVLPKDLPSKDKTLGERLKDPDVNCPQKVIDKIPGAQQ